MNKKSARTLLVLSALVMALVISPAAVSYPNGIQGVKDSGCNCHGAVTSSEVVPSITGLPDQYNYSETYEITVSFVGGPSDPSNINQGGFNLWVSDGELSPSCLLYTSDAADDP